MLEERTRQRNKLVLGRGGKFSSSFSPGLIVKSQTRACPVHNERLLPGQRRFAMRPLSVVPENIF